MAESQESSEQGNEKPVARNTGLGGGACKNSSQKTSIQGRDLAMLLWLAHLAS